jgi:hypothetical protein
MGEAGYKKLIVWQKADKRAAISVPQEFSIAHS